jgi:hypothetical protein
MDIMVKVVVLVVVGLIILITLLGEFGPRSGGGRRPRGSRRGETNDSAPADLLAAHL